MNDITSIFWETIAAYNTATWMIQIVIAAVGVLVTALLYHKPATWTRRAVKLYLVFLYGWIAGVYYMGYCGSRSYNFILAAFWGIIALAWLWDLFANYTTLEYNPKNRLMVGILYIMPFIYPLLSVARGMDFPSITFIVMPCTVAVFTIGLLLAFSEKVNLFVILCITHWALISFVKVFIYKIPEDLLLASSTLPAIYLFFQNYFLQNLGTQTKPSASFMKKFFALIYGAIALALAITIAMEFIK